MKTIGITTTIPIECLAASGYRAVDLNNLFITHTNPSHLVDMAERDGFPLNTCTWIKGIYGACREYAIDRVICVTSGDCSNTLMLMEVLKMKGVSTIPFAYPAEPSPGDMTRALLNLARSLGGDLAAAELERLKLQPARNIAAELDRLTWQSNTISSFENHIWLVSASDFNQDYVKYTRDIEQLISASVSRTAAADNCLRLGYIGVPPVFAVSLYNCIEQNPARVVFNEIQRQFAMPAGGNSLAEQYSFYTYPYTIEQRIADIARQIKTRKIEGLIHYVQSFCHRSIADIIFRARLPVPILTLEGGADFELNTHLQTRVEAFIDMLRRSKIIKRKIKGG
jgi:benzoyl-CoA reductase/2-hydroxyglutaryl-CoA dehydratase subunit BcrC/BadD/HgdB